MTDQAQPATSPQPQAHQRMKPNDAEKYSAFAGGAGLILTGCAFVGTIIPLVGIAMTLFQLLLCGIGFYFGVKGRRQAQLAQTSKFLSTIGIGMAIVNLIVLVAPWLLLALWISPHL